MPACERCSINHTGLYVYCEPCRVIIGEEAARQWNTTLRWETMRKSYRTVIFAYFGRQEAGRIGYMHHQVRRGSKQAGAYHAYVGDAAIGQFDTLAAAKKAIAARVSPAAA
jgi:hypothetical protein